jgi:hypothetical protein
MDQYSGRNFQVGTMLMDNKFEKLRNLVPILGMNTTAANEQVMEVKQCIRLIKKKHGRGM